MNYQLKLFFASWLFLFIQPKPQQQNIRFDHLTVEDGLSQTTANSITQDHHGFMWFGTQDGLNRYDGYNFNVFTSEPGNSNSLSNNYIWSIYEDNAGILWIGSFGGGLTRFDPATESYAHYKNNPKNQNSISSNEVFEILEYPEGTLWIRTGAGINKFDKKNKTFTHYLNKISTTVPTNNRYISAITVQAPNFIWAAIDSFLIKLNIQTNEFEYFLAYPESSRIKFGNIFNIKYRYDDLYVCCDAGLIRIKLSSSESSIILIPTALDGKKTNFNHLLIDSTYYWIGTNNGLYQYNRTSNHFYHFTNSPSNPRSLSHNNVVSLYKSREGIIWIGTYGGISKIDRLKENFSLVQFNPFEKNTLSHKSVGPILEDKNGIVWLGTPSGLNAYNYDAKENIIFKNNLNNPKSLSSNYILCLYEEDDGDIWVGTRNAGLNRFKYDSKEKLKNISFEKIRLQEQNLRIQSIYRDKKGTLWFGTAGRGLIAYDYKTKQSKIYPRAIDGSGPAHSFIYCIYEDSQNNFWIGTPTGGLNLLDRSKEKFIYIKNEIDKINSLSNDIVLSIFEDSKNQLWIGTSGGLNKLEVPLVKNMHAMITDSEMNLSFKHFGRKNGLPNEVIYGVLEDNNNFLWLSTNKGLVKFDPKLERVIKIFDERDGLQNNEFNQNSFFKNKNGVMYFGGIDGFIFFHPDSIHLNNYVPHVRFTDFKLFNKSIRIKSNANDKDFFLSKAIHLLDEIELSHDQNVITFEFAALNFILPDKNQYAYMMEGFDNTWNNAGINRSVTYTNLDPGTYVFRVRASNNDGVWNEAGASLKLIILPPIWLTWYAYVLYAGILVSSIILLLRLRIKAATRELETKAKIERATLDERERVRKKSAADFHDEAGNKLTKVKLFTELARREISENAKLKEYLSKIEENTADISSSMRDFIWVLDPLNDSLLDTINRIKDFGNSMFGYTDKIFIINGIKENMKNITLSIDCRRALMLIFKEAINNCFKYADAGKIEMNVWLTHQELAISLCDDGKGFDIYEVRNSYGLKNMRERSEKIGASLEINSSRGHGTQVIFKGNITHMGN